MCIYIYIGMGSNLQILSDWVDGKNFRPTYVGFLTGSSDLAKEKDETPIGDVWTDKDGKDWKRLGNSTWSRVNTMLDFIKESNPTCSSCFKVIELDNRYDTKAYSKKGKMCFNCLIDRDDRRKLAGTFKLYERQTIFENQKDWVLDMLEQLRAGLENLDANIEVVNEHGGLERWNGLDKKKLEEQMQKDIKEGEDALADIINVLEEVNAEIDKHENG